MDTQSSWYAALLGVLQGTTEFLPVSSSGHLVVVSFFVGGETLPLALNIALHLGTLGAVFVFFWRDWLRLILGAWGRVRRSEKSFESEILLPGLILGSLPAGVVGLVAHEQIEKVFHNPLSVAAPLLVVGIILWWVDYRYPVTKILRNLRLKDAVWIGVAQTFALIPGVSRSGSTIVAGRMLGLSREDAARFSFLLGTPAMAGAALLKGDELLAHAGDPVFYTGFFVSMITGILTIGLLLKFLRRFGFASFAIYRAGLAIVIIGYYSTHALG